MKEIKKSIEIIDRSTEFQEVKDTIREHIDEVDCGLYFTRIHTGAYTENIYIGKVFTVEICRSYGYFEVLGCTRKEEDMLTDYYRVIKEVGR